jgi:hypothetical protein
VQIEHDVSALVMSRVVLVPTLALGTATAAPDHEEEDGRECHGAEQEYQYLPHAVGAYHWNRGGLIPNSAFLTGERGANFAEFLFHALR